MQVLELRVQELSAEMEEKVFAIPAQQAEDEGMKQRLAESMAEALTLNRDLTAATEALLNKTQVCSHTYSRCMPDACPCSVC